MNISVVAELPTTNISTTTIYLIPSADPQTQNVKDEYINLDGTTAGWELIGSTAIDLTGYVTDSELSTALADYVTSTSLASTLSGYVQKSQTAGLLKNDGTVDTNSYATTAALSDKVDKVTGKGLSTNDYTDAEQTKLSGIASGAEVNVQSDWNVTDDTSDAFIKNKPTIPAAQVNSDWNASSGVATNLTFPTHRLATKQEIRQKQHSQTVTIYRSTIHQQVQRESRFGAI